MGSEELGFIGTMLTLCGLGFLAICSVPISPKSPYLYPTKPSKTMSIDVNDDGLEDIVGRDGKVEIRQADGSYVPLRDYLGDRKFFYNEVTERNSVDNLDYSVNTGRHVLVSQ